MRNSSWIVTFLLVLECIVLLIEPSECFLSFIPVSVHTALNILTLLVKIKSIIFKILLGLKLMGVEGFIMRRRRRSLSTNGDSFLDDYTHPNSYLDWKIDSLPESQRTELFRTWERLERLLGHTMQFQESVCLNAVNKFSRRPVAIWDTNYLRTTDLPDDTTTNNVDVVIQEQRAQSRWDYSYWISTVLGSAIGSPYACHILEKELNSRRSPFPSAGRVGKYYYSSRRSSPYSNSVASRPSPVYLGRGAFR